MQVALHPSEWLGCLYAIVQLQTHVLGFSRPHTGERNDTMVGTKAIRFPASLCILEYFRILPASRNFNKSAMLVSQCLRLRRSSSRNLYAVMFADSCCSRVLLG